MDPSGTYGGGRPWPGPPPPAGPPPRSADAFAVVVGNASLLGIGYAMLGRRGLAVASALVSAGLVVLLVRTDHPNVFQFLLVGWWVVGIGIGWLLARPRKTADPMVPVAVPGLHPWSRTRRQRFLALAVTVPVILGLGVVRVDAWRVEGDAADAQRAGECAEALSTLDHLNLAHRIADAPRVARADDHADACELLVEAEEVAADDRLRAADLFERYSTDPGALWDGAADRRAELLVEQAAEEFDAGLSGDTAALDTGFAHLTTVLDENPDQEAAVDGVLDQFLERLPEGDACQIKRVTNWLTKNEVDGGAAARAAEAVSSSAPRAIVRCGDDHMSSDRWKRARKLYRQLVSRYPRHRLVDEARDGVRQANRAIELAVVRKRLKTPSGRKPAYCAKPVDFSQASPYRGPGPHRALIFGGGKYPEMLPRRWRATKVTNAVVVVCVGKMKRGSVAETCSYQATPSASGAAEVKFRERRFRIRAYELRTGKRLATRRLDIGGASCPRTVKYETNDNLDVGPPSNMYVRSSPSDARAAYESLIKP